MATTIQISDSVKVSLEKMKLFSRESYNEVIERMLEDELELNEKTKKELKERIGEKTVSHEEVGRKLGL